MLSDQPGSHAIVLALYVPHVKPYSQAGAILDFKIGSAATHHFILAAGKHTISLELAQPDRKQSTIELRMRSANAYIPRQLGINQDIRLLSVMLLSATYTCADVAESSDKPE
jgi:hypothetical protein